MRHDLLVGARLLEVVERPSAYKAPVSTIAQRDSHPRLVFDAGILMVENPFRLDCDSGEFVGFGSIVGSCVSNAFSTDADFCVVFDGRITLRVSLREEDSIGTNAASYRAHTGEGLTIPGDSHR